MILLRIGIALFLMGLGKGGIPVGAVVLPLLVLVWPDPEQAAKESVGFMLPVLCAMDIVAIVAYRRHISWRRILPPLPGTLLAVALTAWFALREDDASLALTDRGLKALIGTIGLLFVAQHAVRRLFVRPVAASRPGLLAANAFGLAAGITTTLAHAAGPVMQMYFLPQKLPKMQFAANLAAFFFAVNLIKLPFFIATGRIHADNIRLALTLIPVIPLGVLTGYAIVRRIAPERYTLLIYGILAAVSATLLLNACGVL